jgi:hypothetical protein
VERAVRKTRELHAFYSPLYNLRVFVIISQFGAAGVALFVFTFGIATNNRKNKHPLKYQTRELFMVKTYTASTTVSLQIFLSV